jgi:DNA-binding beta-propeller fold protein YncE
VIDAKSRKVVANVNVGKRPQGIVFSPDGRRGYFALSGSNQVPSSMCRVASSLRTSRQASTRTA